MMFHGIWDEYPLETYITIWLVVTGTWLIHFSMMIGKFIIPIDFHIFQRGGYTTNKIKSTGEIRRLELSDLGFLMIFYGFRNWEWMGDLRSPWNFICIVTLKQCIFRESFGPSWPPENMGNTHRNYWEKSDKTHCAVVFDVILVELSLFEIYK